MKGAFRGPLKARSPHQQYVAGGVGDFPRAAPLPVVTNVKPPVSFEDEKAYEISITRAIPVGCDTHLANAVSLQHEVIEEQPAIEG
jgi:hypothetical protein